MASTPGYSLHRASPEEVGIPSASLAAMLRRIEIGQLNLHSLLVIRHGRLVTERNWDPYGPETLHRMYSVSKGFAGVGIGFLIDAGLVRLTDRIVDHFPELVPADVHPWISAMTVRHLLTMSTAHSFTSYKQAEDTDLVRTFFTVPPTRPPGRLFAYDTSAAVVLGALIERVSGLSLTGFLHDRLWSRLGCEGGLRALRTPTALPVDHAGSSPAWREVETNPAGVDQAGSGVMCTPRDLARLGLFCLNRGLVDGRQLLSSDYLIAATTPQISTDLKPGYDPALDAGYGYQIWCTPYDGFAFHGMGGQLALMHPEQDLVVVATADDQLDGSVIRTVQSAVWEGLLPALDDRQASAPGVDPGDSPFFGQQVSDLPAAAKAAIAIGGVIIDIIPK